MLISEIMALFTEEDSQQIVIYDCEKGEEIWGGEYGDYDGKDYEVNSIDTIFTATNEITFNVN